MSNSNNETSTPKLQPAPPRPSLQDLIGPIVVPGVDPIIKENK